MYYHECPICGACLDPGERCDCEEIENPPDDGEDRQAETVVTETTSSISIWEESVKMTYEEYLAEHGADEMDDGIFSAEDDEIMNTEDE